MATGTALGAIGAWLIDLQPHSKTHANLIARQGDERDARYRERIKRESIEAGLSAGLHAREHGGQGWTKSEWVLVEEQMGRSTNALSWHMPTAYNVLANGTPVIIFDNYAYGQPPPWKPMRTRCSTARPRSTSR